MQQCPSHCTYEYVRNSLIYCTWTQSNRAVEIDEKDLSDLPDVPTDDPNGRRGNPPGRRQQQVDNLPFKIEVQFISSHKVEKDCVKFLVKWKGYLIYTRERASFIATKKGKSALKDYLSQINYNDEFEWTRMVQKEPSLIDYMKATPGGRRKR